ncbi:MAG: hypothetical protein EZS28_045968, partial [Streblomastix strix]
PYSTKGKYAGSSLIRMNDDTEDSEISKEQKSKREQQIQNQNEQERRIRASTSNDLLRLCVQIAQRQQKCEVKIQSKDSQQQTNSEVDSDESLNSDPFDQQIQHNYITLGFIGQPNVGKSSLMNEIVTKIVSSVSKQPGHTKHFQTYFVHVNENENDSSQVKKDIELERRIQKGKSKKDQQDDDCEEDENKDEQIGTKVRIVDSPGLVFPIQCNSLEENIQLRALQVLVGTYPLSQLREPYSILRLAVDIGLIQIGDILKAYHIIGQPSKDITMKETTSVEKSEKKGTIKEYIVSAYTTGSSPSIISSDEEKLQQIWSPSELFEQMAIVKGYITTAGRPDRHRAAILFLGELTGGEGRGKERDIQQGGQSEIVYKREKKRIDKRSPDHPIGPVGMGIFDRKRQKKERKRKKKAAESGAKLSDNEDECEDDEVADDEKETGSKQSGEIVDKDS